MDLNANPNTHWAAIFVNELARCGLEAVCIAPGSRSTPLALAVAAHPSLRVYRHLDERSAGFFALGLAKAAGRPVAVICTSGTAAANFHPAIIEAYYSYVPLIVLTADRPPELRQSGANQTIDQIKMYGDHVRWSVELPTPQEDAPEVVLRHLRTLAARAYATADGLIRGPVHLNFPFRKPLEPAVTANEQAHQAMRGGDPFTRINRGRIQPATELIARTADAIQAGLRGLIVCGPDCPGGGFPAAVVALAEASGFPILADPLSNIRHGPQASGPVLGGYGLWLPALAGNLPPPDVVLRFGTLPTSAALSSWLGNTAPMTHIHVREDGEWADDQHLTHLLVQADPALFCAALAAELETRDYQPSPEWSTLLKEAETRAWASLGKELDGSPLFDGLAIAHVLAALPDDAIVFAGNSMPVRYIDAFDRPSGRRLTFQGNRGASGIDGNVSTALGLAAESGRPVVACLGDITFYHDMNGLLAAGVFGLDNVTFLVTNNDGGGIFHRLPIAGHEPPFRALFLTPHGLRFDHAAAMYGLHYAAVTTASELEAVLAAPWVGGGARLIEVITDSANDYECHRAVMAAVTAQLQGKPEIVNES